MLREDEKDQTPSKNWRTYSRSVSWTERRKSTCLPPLQPLSIIRPSVEDWPKPGSDDLGIWPDPPTPGPRPKSLTPRENSTSDREFDCRRDKLAFFDKECSRILDHIYLGSDIIAKNRETLRQNKITHVLNCVGFSCPEYFKNELVYKTLWLQDCPSEDITSILYDVFDYFEDVRERGGRVFVHCCHGVSRSASLVIAYLMWKRSQSFDDAFEFVKKARGVTNPNVGFACQLLQCQKRVHARPASPGSTLRMYRIAPHSPYDPLHLVPKMLNEPGPEKLDSRGAFVIHVPCGVYVWIGKRCSSVMSSSARASALQVIRYERAKGPVVTIKEGDETLEFWDALRCSKNGGVDEKKLDEYDLDYEIFHRALSGGVVPPFTASEAGPETRLPARDNGWNRFSPCRTKNNLTRSRSLNLTDSFSSFSVGNNKPRSNSTSPSASPSTSDYSSSFTFSPSSSNRSDSSFVSAQSSPYVNESKDSVDENTRLLDNVTLTRKEKAIFDSRVSRGAGFESSIPVRMILLPSIDEASHISENLTRYLGDDVMEGGECNNASREGSFRIDDDDEEAISDVNR